MLTRRRLIVGATAGAAFMATGRLWAATTVAFGGTRIDAVSDGALVLPADFVYGALPAEALAIVEQHGTTGADIRRDCNLTLLRDGERTVLFDAGAGPGFMPSTGELIAALAAIGVDPAEVTHVVFTHGHPDHLWGVLDDFDEPAFVNAAYLIGRKEWDHWMAPGTLDATPEDRKSFVVGAQRRLPAIEDRTGFFDDGAEVLPGIFARATHGHTEGHMSFVIERDGESLMVVGDVLVDPHLAFERPDLPGSTDHDPGMAAATRIALLDQLATDRMPFLGYHLPYPGIGRAERVGDAYRYVPAG